MSRLPTARVLVVDDEVSVLETIAAILRREGYEVAAASSVAEAIELLDHSAFEVALTDLRLEGASGLSLLSTLHQHWPQTVSIVLTGYASIESAIDALREGAFDYLIKPCDVEELKATVARAVQRSSLSRSLRQRLEHLDAANARLQTYSDELQERIREMVADLSGKVIELADAKHALEQEQRRRAELTSMIAHELSQPLAAVRGFAQILGRANSSPETRENAREAIIRQTSRLTRLVRDLSDVAHLASGTFRIQRGVYDLTSLVREQTALAQNGTTDHTIRLEAPESEVLVTCDRDRISQVLSNFLDNAIKYSPGGKINVVLRQEDGRVAIAVTDQGPGIPADYLESIFEPYTRLDQDGHNAEKSGSGLGLHIAKGIAQAHGGQIWAESLGPNQGTTFTVVLPTN
jgi:two-component system, sensor histidine kinase